MASPPPQSHKAAHRVLRNPSLVSEILGFVTLRPTTTSMELPPLITTNNHNLKTCLAMALTCTWLLESALDEMWSAMNDLRPLIQLIPGLIHIDNKIHTYKPLQHSQLKRVEYHARRVRSLRIFFPANPNPLAWTESSLFVQLLVVLRGEPLLPCLHCLIISGQASSEQIAIFSAMLPLLPCVTIQYVYLDPCYRDSNNPHILSLAPIPPILQFLNALALIPNSNLTTLGIMPHVLFRDVTILPLFPGLQRLSVLCRYGPTVGLPVHPGPFLHYLRLLENLCDLVITIVGSPRPTLNKASAVVLTFPSLTSLRLSSDIRSTVKLLTFHKFPALKTFTFNAFSQPAETNTPLIWQESWVDLVERITEGQQTLQTLVIRQPPSNNVPHVSWHSCTPFLRLRGLTVLALLCVQVISLSHDDFITLTDSLPHLQVLQLPINEMPPDSLLFLIEARARLLSLKILAISLDWRAACPALLLDLSPDNPRHPLKSLTILQIPADHAMEIKRILTEDLIALHSHLRRLAEFLFSIFPDVIFATAQHLGISALDGYMKHHMIELKVKYNNCKPDLHLEGNSGVEGIAKEYTDTK